MRGMCTGYRGVNRRKHPVLLCGGCGLREASEEEEEEKLESCREVVPRRRNVASVGMAVRMGLAWSGTVTVQHGCK